MSTLFPCPRFAASTLFLCPFGPFRVSAHFFRAHKLGSAHFFCASTVLLRSFGPFRAPSHFFRAHNGAVFFPVPMSCSERALSVPVRPVSAVSAFSVQTIGTSARFSVLLLCFGWGHAFSVPVLIGATQRSRRGRRPKGWRGEGELFATHDPPEATTAQDRRRTRVHFTSPQ